MEQERRMVDAGKTNSRARKGPVVEASSLGEVVYVQPLEGLRRRRMAGGKAQDGGLPSNHFVAEALVAAAVGH